MSAPPRARLAEAEREAQRARHREMTVCAVAQLRTSAGWQAWLRVRAQTGLRRYSVRNQLMIALQDPEATRVAGFRAWQALGYSVRRGERSRIRVWARCEPSRTKLEAWRDAGADPRTKPKACYRLEAVFDRAQVNPLPPPAEPAPLDAPVAPIAGDTLAWTLPELTQVANAIDVTVSFAKLAEGHDGSYQPAARQITINDRPSVNQQAAALVHELAHALVDLDHHDENPELDYAMGELVAESVAHIVCGFLGLDTSANSIPYLASWSEHTPADAFERIAGLVDRLAGRLEDTLEPTSESQ